MSEPVYYCVYIRVTNSVIQNEMTQREDVLVCVFRQTVREILLIGEYTTTKQAIKRTLIVNHAHQILLKKLSASSVSVCLSLALFVCVAFILYNT